MISIGLFDRMRKSYWRWCLTISALIIGSSPVCSFAPAFAADPKANPVTPAKQGSGSAPAAASAAAPAPVPDSGSQTSGDTADVIRPIKYGDFEGAYSNHEVNKTLNLTPLFLSSKVEMRSFATLRQEAKLDQSITLRDAINYVLDHGMPIKISRESMNYQHFLTLSNLAGFVPSFATTFNVSAVRVTNLDTLSLARTFQVGFSFPVFQGGGVLYTALSQRYREKAWQYAYKATVSDVFLDIYTKYTNLLLQRVLLQISAKSVEADEEQLKVNTNRFNEGVATKYDVIAADAQLSADRQQFLQQEINMRQAGLQLNLAMNYPLSINLIPAEETLTEAPMFGDNVQLNGLMQDAYRFNPGLRQYENFRLAATRNIQAQAASLYPTVAFIAIYQINDTTVNPAGNSAALGGSATSSITSFLNSTFAGRVSNNALGQQFTFSPTAGSTSTQGANTGPSATPAAAGGTPIALIQSGSLVSSGAVAPSIFGGGTGAAGATGNVNGALQAPAGIFPGFFHEFQAGFQMSWTLPAMGLQTVATMLQSKVLARQALMQCNQEISVVIQEVHNDYLAMLNAREVIDKAAVNVAANRENLRLARARYDQGTATSLEVVQAQRAYVTAFTGHAQAIVASNVAQAQLLHDMGMISATTLTNGYHPGVFTQPKPTSRLRWLSP
jgi:outer membrane protein TolC